MRVFGFEPSLAWDRFVNPITTEWFAFFYFCYFFLLAAHIFPIVFGSRDQMLLGEFMLGYQRYFGVTRISLYAGANIEHHANDDPFAAVAGTRWGFKTQGEIFTSFAP